MHSAANFPHFSNVPLAAGRLERLGQGLEGWVRPNVGAASLLTNLSDIVDRRAAGESNAQLFCVESTSTVEVPTCKHISKVLLGAFYTKVVEPGGKSVQKRSNARLFAAIERPR